MRRRLPLWSGAALAALLVSAFPGPAAARDKITLTVDGITRTALVDPGRDAATSPSPLVFAFHEAGGTSTLMAGRGLAQAWPEAIFVYPDGLRRPSSLFGITDTEWQTHPGEYDDQDVHFVDALLDQVEATYQVDPRRVYATGLSKGAAFCVVLLTLRPERFAAFAPVAAGDPPCLKWATLPRPYLLIQGTGDTGFGTAQWARDQLLSLNGCSPDAAQRPGSSTLYSSCASGQPVLFSPYSGGDLWPPGATASIVPFFQQQALPAAPTAPMAAPAPVDASGTIAGSGRGGFAGDGGSATAARLLWPEAVAVDAAGRLLIADTGNQRVRAVGLDGIIHTVVGQAAANFGPTADRNGTAGPLAHLAFPEGIVAGPDGGFYVADTYIRLVRHVTSSGQVSTVVGKTPIAHAITFSGDGGPGTKAELSFPTGLAVDSQGNLFIADTENHRIRKLGPDGIITTVAGTGTPGFAGDGGPALQAQLNEPWGLALDSHGNLFIADTFNQRVRKLAPGGTISTVAGTGTAGFSGDDGPAAAAELNHPLGLTVDSQGNLFIVDAWNYRVRRVAPDGTITTVFGATAGDESAAPSPRYYPSGVAVDAAGNLLIADPFNQRVWKVSGIAAPGLLAGKPFPPTR